MFQEVARFLDFKHKDHYKVYNLCSEKTYDDTYFHGRVERFIIDDHNVPSIKYVTFIKMFLYLLFRITLIIYVCLCLSTLGSRNELKKCKLLIKFFVLR